MEIKAQIGYYENEGPGIADISDTDVWVILPTTQKALQDALSEANPSGVPIGSVFVKAAKVADCEVPGIEWLLEEVKGTTDINELNYFASKVSGLDNDDLIKMYAVIESGRHITGDKEEGSFADYINIADNLDAFTFHPGFDEEGYGEYLLGDPKSDLLQMMDELRKSSLGQYYDFATLIDALREAADATQFGEAMAKNNDGDFIGDGYIIEDGSFSTYYYGPENVPDEYRVWEPDYRYHILADIELPTLFVEMHSLAGNYTQELEENFKALMTGECFIILSENGLTAVAAKNVLYRDSVENLEVNNLTPPTRVFFAFGYDGAETGSPGAIYELNPLRLSQTVNRIGFEAEHIDADLKDGGSTRYSKYEWTMLPDVERRNFAGVSKRYSADNQTTLNRFIGNLCAPVSGEYKATDIVSFLHDVNKNFMIKAACLQPNMLRIARETAAHLLARDEADIYRLMNGGPTKLAPLDAITSKGLWFENFRHFAIKPDGLDGLHKWAERTADKLFAKISEQKKDLQVNRTDSQL